jgi:hypothetical protein
MPENVARAVGLIVGAFLLLPVASEAQAVPKTWDEAALASALIPPPVASAIIKQVPAEYYYRMRERVMYRIYPVYASKAEPRGYLEKLALVEPEITFDAAKLKTEQGWIAAGRDVYRYPIALFPIQMLATLREILERSAVPPARDGTYPHLRDVLQLLSEGPNR